MNSNRVRQILDEVWKEFNALTPAEQEARLKEHENGEFAVILRESGAIDVIMETLKRRQHGDSLIEKQSQFKVLKKNKMKLTDEERDECMKAGACWHPTGRPKQCAI